MGERLQSDGLAPAGGTPEQLYEQIRKELDQWRQVIQRAGIRRSISGQSTPTARARQAGSHTPAV